MIWLDCQMITAWGLPNSTQLGNVAKIHHFFMAGGKVMEHPSSAVSTQWTNCVWKCWDAVLSQFKEDIPMEDRWEPEEQPYLHS